MHIISFSDKSILTARQVPSTITGQAIAPTQNFHKVRAHPSLPPERHVNTKARWCECPAYLIISGQMLGNESSHHSSSSPDHDVERAIDDGHAGNKLQALSPSTRDKFYPQSE